MKRLFLKMCSKVNLLGPINDVACDSFIGGRNDVQCLETAEFLEYIHTRPIVGSKGLA